MTGVLSVPEEIKAGGGALSHSSGGHGHQASDMELGLRPGVFLVGLLLLLGPGITQIHISSGQNTLEGQLWPETVENFPFLCNPKKLGLTMPSESVHSLMPADIKFIAAIGNMETLPDSGTVNLEENKRIEKPQQACKGVMTVLADFISHFNPSVLRPMCPTGKSAAPYNDVVTDLRSQAEELVRSLKENPQLDFHRDWKLVNVFFSNASLCYLCSSAHENGPLRSDMDKLAGVLHYLHQEVPRAFVNLVDLSEVVAMPHWHPGTRLSGPALESCGCSGETSKLSTVVRQWFYQEAWDQLLVSSGFNKQESFAVVFQPLFYKVSLPGEGPPSQDPSTLALSLWNNMMKPVGHKDELFSAKERKLMKCPSQESPYLFTYRNSNYQSRSLKPQRQPEVREGTEIRCPDMSPSDSIPTSVHRLKPADIKVIGAMGDSLTAGNGAGSKPWNVLDILTQYRGLSWSIGGDQNISTMTTLPNILREFNPSLKGFSTGIGTEKSAGAFLNQAVAGARAENLASQAERLVDLMRTDARINFQEDWKLITVFIGGNDLCDFCDNPVRFSPYNFTDNIRKALDIFHAEVPRAFVNMVKVLQIVNLRELYQSNNISCPRQILRALCPCVLTAAENSTNLNSLIDFNKKYQEGTDQLIKSGRYDTREDFTVVVQPLFEKVDIPKTPEGIPDSSFFAPDCFHFSTKTHSRAAVALWKNMLEPIGQKAAHHNFEIKIDVFCPNQVSPFLRTYNNSIEDHGTWLACADRTPSASTPTSVHALRPADIHVVAALGDSLTAGNGIGSKPGDLPDVTTQYRGLSYSSGGDGSLANVTTLPNILLEFNRNLTGYAVGTGDANDANAFLNQAVPGAKAEDLMKQVQSLVQKMKDDRRINFQEDWKVITVLIGASDLCHHCTDSNLYSADNFFNHLRNALDVLHREVPRALVNLVDFMNPRVVRQVFLGNPDKCPVQQASVLCNCVLTPRENSYELAKLDALTQAYQSSIRKLVESGRYDTREDFSVVLQPFFLNIQLPVLEDGRPDTSFFAPDCIHPSQKFHSQLSRALWVNMEEPFLRTPRNSNYTYPTKPAIENWGSDFLCTEWNPSNSIPTSVHELRPADIKVVAALGDSLTTAVGARPSNSSDLYISWRGLSWSIGGDGALETHTTLPNILKKFNPSILGFSTGTLEKTQGFNVAVEGARAQDMPAQARDLVERMKTSTEINPETDWKLVTLFIGSNDLCQYCENPADPLTEEYVQHIQQALDIFYEKLPRAFINVVEVMELASLHQGQGGQCAVLLAAQRNCSCLRHFPDSPVMQELKKVNWNLQSGISRFSYQQKYMQREDFAVVVQPFFQNTLIPLNELGTTDITFFSEDCLHFSERGHAEMAIALWNNMLEPVGQKTTFNNFTHSRAKLKCPSPESPYLYTLRNSPSFPDQAAEASSGFPWPVPVAAVGGLIVGVLVVSVWTAIRRYQEKAAPASPPDSSF
ncbi:phospholipase B1, membrane-associated isoform X2 [Fukomys damarensis]|uniref:phospholipase B1, membrane-associated isoform X2 n=1 Tax=Fukomys damarensis TaxID=885580 RepID=UPI001455746F|nr:phospholipase B1, membrane-associated isoform X2 [Fukomys damarensis]